MIKLVPTLLEVLTLFYLAEHFFAARVNKTKRYIANICFYLLDCCAICVFQETLFIKHIIVILLITLWAKYIYHVHIINNIFLIIFQFSYWYIIDLLFFSISSLFFENINNQTKNFYLLYILIKVAELIIVVVACRIFCQHKDTSWQSNLRVLAFPVCLLCVSIYLFSISMEEPKYAAKLLICIVLLLTTDIFSIYLLEYLENQQYNFLPMQSMISNQKHVLRQHQSTGKIALKTQPYFFHQNQSQANFFSFKWHIKHNWWKKSV